jgi:hypothetical protein
MKKLSLCLFFIVFSFILKGQDTLKYFVNGTPLDSINVEYVRIVGTSKFLSTKVSIELDFGQYNSIWKDSDTRVTNNLGKRLELNGMVDALNFMVSNGYEFITAYAITVNNQNVYHYLLRKMKKSSQ